MADDSATTQTTAAPDTGSTSTAQLQPAGESTAAVASRPEWLPESYWDGEKNAPNVEAIKAADEARAERESRLKDIPQDGAYKFELPEDFTKSLPEGVKYEAPSADDPEVKAFFGIAKELGLTQSQMRRMLGFEAQRRLAAFQNAQKMEAARQAELKTLGENAGTRVEAAQRWLNTNFSEPQAKMLGYALNTKDGVEAIEAMASSGWKTRGQPNGQVPKQNAALIDDIGKRDGVGMDLLRAANSQTH